VETGLLAERWLSQWWPFGVTTTSAASAGKRRMPLEEQTIAEVKIPSAAAGCELAMAAGAEDDAAVEAGDGCVLVQDSEKNCLFGMWSKAPDAACGS